MKGKIKSTGIYTGYMIFLTALIGTQLLAPVVVPELKLSRVIGWGIFSAILFLSFYLSRGKQKAVPAVLLAALVITGIYLIGSRNILRFLNEYRETIIIIFLGLGFCFLNLIMERFIQIRRIAGMGLIGYLGYSMITGYVPAKITIALIYLFLITIVVEWLQNSLAGKRMIVYLLPFLSLFFIGIMVIKPSSEPYDWSFVKEMYANVRESVTVLLQVQRQWMGGGQEDFGLQFSGLSEAGKVGGNIIDREQEMMRLTLKKGMRIKIYLTGNVFDTFDGKNWQCDMEQTSGEQQLDLVETLYAVQRYDADNMMDYIYSGELSCYYTQINTGYLFAPLKTQGIYGQDKWADTVKEQDGQPVFSNKKGYGTAYYISFYQMNLGQPFFEEMIRQESRYQYQQKQIDEDTSEEMLALHARRMKEKYIRPYEMNDEVKEFLQKITEGCTDDYERCKAIEQVLNQYHYTKYPAQVPEGREFLEFFLLESQEGYCTYFATAFVLLARELGIPARYVQGFCVNDGQLGAEEISITSSMAHAWAEVYFEGVGWIPFEPTPSYGTARYQRWKSKQAAAEEREYRAFYQPEELPITEVPAGTSAYLTPENNSRIREWAGLALIIIVVMGSIAMTVDYLLRRQRYKKYSLDEKMKYHIKRNLYILKCMGYELLQGETIGELKRRIHSRPGEETVSLEFIDLFETVYYGRNILQEYMVEKIRKEEELLKDRVRNAGRRKYIWFCIRLAIAEGAGYERS